MSGEFALLFIAPDPEERRRLEQDTRTGVMLGLCPSLMVVATAAVALRLWARKKAKIRLQAEDWTIIVALVSFPFARLHVQSSLLLLSSSWSANTDRLSSSTHLGSQLRSLVRRLVSDHEGRLRPSFTLDHNSRLRRHCEVAQGKGPASPFTNVPRILPTIEPHYGLEQYFFTIDCLFIVSSNVTRLSILLFYRGLFRFNQHFRRALYLLFFLIFAQAVAFFFVNIFQCRPIKAFWDRLTPRHTCITRTHFLLPQALCNVLADLFILTLPMPILWSLQIDVRKKIAVGALFVLGSG